MCPDRELNQRLFGSQAGAQSTEPHQPGWEWSNLDKVFILTESKRREGFLVIKQTWNNKEWVIEVKEIWTHTYDRDI